MLRTLCALGIVVAMMSFAGCGNSKGELGPVDAADVHEANPDDIKKGMEESAKHLPKGMKMPEGTIPGDSK